MQRSSFQALGRSALEPADQFILRALRAWVQCCKERALPSTAVEQAFAEIGLPEAADAFDTALRFIAEATTRPLLVHCPHCPGVSEDEWLLLGAVAATQHRAFDVAHDLLGEIVRPGCTARVIVPLGSLGLMLALAGIDLAAPENHPAQNSPAAGAAPRPAATLH